MVITDVMCSLTGCRTKGTASYSADNSANRATDCRANDAAGNRTAACAGYAAHCSITFMRPSHFRSGNMHIAAIGYFTCIAGYTSLVHCFCLLNSLGNSLKLGALVFSIKAPA
jgi:hypothetical protein